MVNMITKVAKVFRLEFAGDGYILRDRNNINKYSNALIKLQLCDICEIRRYICIFQEYYYHIYNQVDNISAYFTKRLAYMYVYMCVCVCLYMYL